MYTNCDEIFRLTVPAVRIAVAKELSRRYGFGQAMIAHSLDIAQPAVSRYLHSNYSARIKRLEKVVETKRLGSPVVKAIIGNWPVASISSKIDQVASSEYMVKKALSLL